VPPAITFASVRCFNLSGLNTSDTLPNLRPLSGGREDCAIAGEIRRRPYRPTPPIVTAFSAMIRCACSARHRLTARRTVRACLSVNRSGCRFDALQDFDGGQAGLLGQPSNDLLA